MSTAYLSTHFPLCIVCVQLCPEKLLFKVYKHYPPQSQRMQPEVYPRLPCSKNSTARSAGHLDALWTNANLQWEKQAPFFCRQLLYVLEDEIWRAICGGDHFLKCMCSAWKTKNKKNQMETQTFWCQLLHRRQLLIFGNFHFPTVILVQLQGRLWTLDYLVK